MSDKVEIAEGAKVLFSVGKARTTYEARVTGRKGVFLVTTDDAGKVRKVRPGSCAVL